MRAGELTEDEAREQPCPFGLYDGKCIAAKCRVAWRWTTDRRPKIMVTPPGKDVEEQFAWDPRAYRGHEAWKVRIVPPPVTGFCGALGDPSEKPDYSKDVEGPKRLLGG